MTQSKLSFNSLTLWYNPRTFSITHQKQIHTQPAPYIGEIVDNIGMRARRVSGLGELFGDQAFERYRQLCKEFDRQQDGLLTLPGFAPFPAYFTKLSLSGTAGAKWLTYEFEFIERTTVSPDPIFQEKSYTAVQGDTLWSISAKTGVSQSALSAANPLAFGVLEVGQKVRIP